MVTNDCAKFDYDRLRIGKVLENCENSIITTKTRRTFVALGHFFRIQKIVYSEMKRLNAGVSLFVVEAWMSRRNCAMLRIVGKKVWHINSAWRLTAAQSVKSS